MTPEAQRIAIAEACDLVSPFHLSNEYEETGGMDGDSCFVDVLRDANDIRVSDYLRDLDAMHWAEKKLQHYGYYCDKLAEVMNVPRGSLLLISAPASQRAEAFLKAIDKWVE